jgi:hypothetical protein
MRGKLMNKQFLPGRLGNPDATFLDDPRADPRIVAMLQMSVTKSEYPSWLKRHLGHMNRLPAPARRSSLLPLWRLAGFLTGFLPAYVSEPAVWVPVA